MAITTLDGAIAGVQAPKELMKVVAAAMEAAGVRHSLFYAPGMPGAAVAPSPGMGGAALTSYAGQVPWTNPGSGNSYLYALSVSASHVGVLYLLDRLWHNSGIAVTTTTAPTINSAALPARDIAGTTNGDGVMVAIEVSTATTNAGAVTGTVLSYTNQAGTAGRVATMASFPATAAAGTFVPFQLQAGDTGIRSIQTITLTTSYGAGAIHLVAYRQIAAASVLLPSGGANLDAADLGFPRLFNDSVLFPVWLASSTTAPTIIGSLTVTQG